MFSCCRCSMSAVTRRIVSCVLRRMRFLRGGQRCRDPVIPDAGIRRRSRAATDRPDATRARGSGRSLEAGIGPLDLVLGGATNITYSRSASAPNFSQHRVGVDDVPFDFDITAPSFSTMPCVRSWVNGSL